MQQHTITGKVVLAPDFRNPSKDGRLSFVLELTTWRDKLQFVTRVVVWLPNFTWKAAEKLVILNKYVGVVSSEAMIGSLQTDTGEAMCIHYLAEKLFIL